MLDLASMKGQPVGYPKGVQAVRSLQRAGCSANPFPNEGWQWVEAGVGENRGDNPLQVDLQEIGGEILEGYGGGKGSNGPDVEPRR